MKQYKVTCLECDESDVITVDELNHRVTDYKGKFNTPFLAFRWRPDSKWGFSCKCGNNNQLANNEADEFDNLVKGDPLSVKRIAESLLINRSRRKGARL